MTYGELIEQLKKNDPQTEAKILVRVHTRRFTVAEVTPFDADHRGIWISLPNNMHVVERKP